MPSGGEQQMQGGGLAALKQWEPVWLEWNGQALCSQEGIRAGTR